MTDEQRLEIFTLLHNLAFQNSIYQIRLHTGRFTTWHYQLFYQNLSLLFEESITPNSDRFVLEISNAGGGIIETYGYYPEPVRIKDGVEVHTAVLTACISITLQMLVFQPDFFAKEEKIITRLQAIFKTLVSNHRGL